MDIESRVHLYGCVLLREDTHVLRGALDFEVERQKMESERRGRGRLRNKA